jgi:hypothetical protein
MAGAFPERVLAAPLRVQSISETAVLKTLAYFDIFQYPLKKSEIKQFSCNVLNDQLLDAALNDLVAAGLIFLHEGFYSLQNNPLRVSRRILGNLRAALLLPKAYKIGRFLYRFPFVRSVAISGSLSKNFADEKADIDFFIITKANRLWIARTLMHLYKKITFLTGRQHFYCMNYYIDENALLLNEQNIFTAMEIKTLLPVSGKKAVDLFFSANQWSSEWLPVCEFRQLAAPEPHRQLFKYCFEWMGNNRLGNILDNCLMRISKRRWQAKERKGKQNEKGQKMGLITGKHFARSNPGAFQEVVLDLYVTKLEQLGISN